MYLLLRADCVDLLAKCLDMSRLQDPRQTSEALCDMIAVENEVKTGCVSIKDFIPKEKTPGEAGTGEERLQEEEDDDNKGIPHLSHPCQSNSCLSGEICLVNRDCKQGQACVPFHCTPGTTSICSLLFPEYARFIQIYCN